LDYFVRTEVAAPGPAPGFEIRDPRTKVKYFGEFREFALDREAAARPGHPEPGLTENGAFVIFILGSLGVLNLHRNAPGAPGNQLGLIHRLSTSLLLLGSLGV